MFIKEGKTNWKYILIVVVLAIIVGRIIYWQYQEMQKEELGGEINVPEKGIEDETANWKTHRNEEYGFEIKYPNEWGVYEDPFVSEVIFGPTGPPALGGFSITIVEVSKEKTLKEYLEKRDEERGVGIAYEIRESQETELSGILAIQREEIFKAAVPHLSLVTYLKRDSLVFEFYMLPTEILPIQMSERDMQFNNIILSTFRFID